MKTKALFLGAFALLLHAPPAPAQKNLPAPAWKSGESLFYRVHFKINRDIKTKSALSLPQTPTDADLDVLGILQVAPLPSNAPATGGAIHLRTWFLTLVGDLSILPRGAKPRDGKTQHVPAEDKYIDCTVEPNGEIDQITGLEALAPEQQQAWREWAARFAAPSTLLQKSSAQDSTPADYKQRGLRTRGTAKGANEIILYISRKTGQLIRSTQKAAQQMDVLIAVTDGSAQIHYDINAKADSSVE